MKTRNCAPLGSSCFLCTSILTQAANSSNDALRQYGIIPPKPAAPKTPSPPASPTLASALAAGSPTLDELDLLDEAAVDSDEERLIASYKRQRLNEMKAEGKATRRFGEVQPIGRDDYTREVTEASKVAESDEEEKHEGDGWHGTGVVCFLYQDGYANITLCGRCKTDAIYSGIASLQASDWRVN